MDTGTDTTMVIPTLGFSSGPQLFLYLLLRQFDTTMSDHIPLMIITTSKMIGYGFRDTWNIGKPPMVGKESGYLAIGNGDRINKKI